MGHINAGKILEKRRNFPRTADIEPSRYKLRHMATDCYHCPLRDKPLFSPIAEDDLAETRRFKSGETVLERGEALMTQGAESAHLYTVLDGYGLRYRVLPDGRRQVLNFVFPGDFIGLQAGVMGEMQHSVEATTPMRLCRFERDRFFAFISGSAERAFELIWLAATEEVFLGEAMTTIGQRDAAERIAWALVKIIRRSQALDLGDGYAIPMPFRQQDLADALGLSLVHTNKTLARLRDRQIVNWADRRLTVGDLSELERIAQMRDGPERVRPLI